MVDNTLSNQGKVTMSKSDHKKVEEKFTAKTMDETVSDKSLEKSNGYTKKYSKQKEE